ncbi:MAG: hypothetical protein ACNA8P_01075 [Phycisphaerales bacterium]
MNGRLRKIVGGCVALGCAAVCVLPFLTESEAHAATDTTWKAVDHSNMFLHDLTSGSAVFVAAMVVDADGAVTAQVAELNKVKFAPVGSKVTAAKADDALSMESQLDGEVVLNATQHTVMAYFQTSAGLTELRLLPNEGVAVGELADTTALRFRWGCKCICEHGPGVFEPAIMYCSEVFPDAGNQACDCTSLVTVSCWFLNQHGELVEGQMNGCKSGLLPVGINPGN